MYTEHRIEGKFGEGGLVFLQLHPYHQSTLKQKGVEKLQPHLYGSYQVIKRVGEVAYELELPLGRNIYNVFHASCLKKALG